MHQSTTFPPTFAKATAGRQSAVCGTCAEARRNTHCSYTTAGISLNTSGHDLCGGLQKSCIWAPIERDMPKLFWSGA